jgi:hypothetical protein
MRTEPTGCALIYDLAPKQAVRLILRTGEVPRALLWFMVGKDSSIYLGSVRRLGQRRARSIPADGKVEIKYEDGE